MTNKGKPAELGDGELDGAVGGGFTGGVRVATGDVNGDGTAAHELAHVQQGTTKKKPGTAFTSTAGGSPNT